MDNLILYTADGCKFCDETKSILIDQGALFEERNVSHSNEYLQESKRLGNRWLPILQYGSTVLVSPKANELLDFIRQYKSLSGQPL